MKLQYVGHGDDPVGLVPPICDLHDRWLVPPTLARPDAPGVVKVLKPGDFIDLHEVRDKHWCDFLRSHRDFKVVNAGNHPELHGYRYGG